MLLIAIVWLALQVLGLLLLRGRWRTLAMVPAAVMAVAVGVGIVGGLVGSNLAPIWIVFALPVCAVWMVLLWTARGIAVLLLARRVN